MLKKKVKIEVLEWIKTISMSIILAFIMTSFFQPTIVNGCSMYPTLNDKEYLIVNKLEYKTKTPQRGDIVVFKTELIEDENNNKNKNLVKRVIALPGEHIRIENGKVYINNNQLNESYLNNISTEGDVDMIVPEKHIFIMGDNRNNSLDSRDPMIGTVNLENIVGKVIIRLYPFDKLGKIN